MKKDKKPYHSIRKPNFLGNRKAFREFLSQNLVYPKEAIENKAEGTAHVKCEISDKGIVLKTATIRKLGFGLDEEAERLCMLMRFEDTTERGLKIKHTRTVRIPFVLPKNAPRQNLQINYQSTSSEKKGEEKKSYTYTIKF